VNPTTWRYINIALVLLGLVAGYASLAPEKLVNTNPDLIFCAASLVATTIVCVGGTYYSLFKLGNTSLRRPSWNRHPFKIWYDPLQFMAFGIAYGGAFVLGAFARLPSTGRIGLWTLAWDCSVLLGFILGVTIVIRLFRSRITDA
jgi:hypothetical protein